MTDSQFQKWMSLNFDFKKACFKAMTPKDQMDCLNKATKLNGGSRFCYDCISWNKTGNGYGICNCQACSQYQQQTNEADECVMGDAEEAMTAINEAIRENIQYSQPT